eukprot:5423686-Prymnesium_polylepis.1
MPVAPSAWPSSYTSLATSWLSDACRLDGLIDARLVSVAETGREHGARCDRREGGCTCGPCPPVADRYGTFQPLS